MSSLVIPTCGIPFWVTISISLPHLLMSDVSSSPKVTIRAVSAWLFGSIFLISGLGLLVSNVIGGLALIAVSLVLLPPISKRLKVDFSTGIKIVLSLIAIGIVSATTNTDALTNNASSSASTTTSTTTKPVEQETKQEQAQLEIQSTSSSRQYSFLEVTGEVKNITDKKMDNIQVVVSFYDVEGNFIKDGTAIIEYNPILAGQTSPFTVIETDNPAIENWTITFKKLFGGTIPTTSRQKQ